MTKYLHYVIAIFVALMHCYSAEENHAHHGHSDKNKLVGEIAEAIDLAENSTQFSSKDTRKLFKKLGFKNCSAGSVKGNCQLCLSSEDLRKWYSFQPVVNSSDFKESLPAIIYFLSPRPRSDLASNLGAVCNTSIVKAAKNLTSSPRVFEFLVSQYGGKSGRLDEKILDTILEEINSTIGQGLTKKPCFSVEDVIKGANITHAGADEHEFEYVSAYIILQLLNGRCIAEHEEHTVKSNLPTAQFFIQVLFLEYAVSGTIPFENFEKLLQNKLKIGKESSTTTSTTSTDSHAGHNHRRKKRSVDDKLELTNEVGEENHHRQRRSMGTSSHAKTCFSPENIFKIHSLNQTTGVTQSQFKDLCPTLIQQIESGVCAAPAKTTTSSKQSDWKAWIASILSTFIISLFSMVGVLAIPFSKKKYFTSVLTVLIALGISTLLGDALLHLLPHSLGLHKHEESGTGAHAHESHLGPNSYLWKCLVFIVGVYAFYMFECIMHSMSKHDHSHGLRETHQHVGKTGQESHTKVSGTIELNLQEQNGGKDSKNSHKGLIRTPSGVHKCDHTGCPPSGVDQKQANGTRHSNTELIGDEKSSIKNMHSVAWMILLGDAIHNFMDGVAIGVAFTEKFPSGLYGGISTSIAILCHELPHELGDFAILLKTGLSVKYALTLNFISSLMALFGAIVGVSIAQQFDASFWIFAVTGGLFVYIALVDMLPELLHSSALRHSPVKNIILQNIGLFIGFGIMILLAAYEENLKTAFK